MILENKLGITNGEELARAEERISKRKVKQFFDTGDIRKVEIGTFAGLALIHAYLFEDIYDFAGKLREVDIAKGGFRFALAKYLEQSLERIDAMPQSAFDEIIEKYVEMNVAHPFRDGNGRATRIWLDLILRKEIKQVVDWSKVDKADYFSAITTSVMEDAAIKALLKNALSERIDDRALFMRGIDASYYFEDCHEFEIDGLS